MNCKTHLYVALVAKSWKFIRVKETLHFSTDCKKQYGSSIKKYVFMLTDSKQGSPGMELQSILAWQWKVDWGRWQVNCILIHNILISALLNTSTCTFLGRGTLAYGLLINATELLYFSLLSFALDICCLLSYSYVKCRQPVF